MSIVGRIAQALANKSLAGAPPEFFLVAACCRWSGTWSHPTPVCRRSRSSCKDCRNWAGRSGATSGINYRWGIYDAERVRRGLQLQPPPAVAQIFIAPDSSRSRRHALRPPRASARD